MKNKYSLACSNCGTRNYTIDRKKSANEERLEIKKYCRRCNAHTIHKETK